MTVYLRICFSSQPVLLRRRAVRRGANAGPIATLSYMRCPKAEVVRHPPTPERSYSRMDQEWRARAVGSAGTKFLLAQAGRTAGCQVTVASRAPAQDADTTRHPAGLEIELMSMQPRAHTLRSGLGNTLIESDGGTQFLSR